jgi:Dockerin type I domain
MSLTSPSGEVITRSTTDPLVNHSLGSTYEVYSISLPEAGSWTVSLYGADVAVEGEQVNLGFTTTLRVPGDVDLDGAATCADVAIVKASFGKKIGQTGFDVRADLNGDGVVNILDLAQVAKNLLPGVTCK